jgi:HEPN domain-containing protein
MREPVDLTRGWIKKAQSDLAAVDALIAARSFDTACFHAQQAAEKYLKAFLTHYGVTFPATHNLAKLVELGARTDESLRTLTATVEPLTPYAVETRYDAQFWPSRDVAENARLLAKTVEQAVLSRLPAGVIRRSCE